jgi:cysteinyl-tRNA synthetase
VDQEQFMLRIYNTLTRKVEEFQTLEPGKVKMYVCGVTVYNEAHIGHAMSALVFDIIRRYLEYRGYQVKHVMNFTDVDDKIIARANQLGEDPFALANRYIEDYRQNLRELNVLPATSNPRATQTMQQIQNMIQGLIDKGYAYVVPGGDVYFHVEKFAEYGKLSGRDLSEMIAGTRFDVDKNKRNPLDFALWKAAKPGEPSWDSPWGKGRPGWHIECSAMNLAELGEQIDIHGGGNDLVFPHHENEIAQSEAYTGKPFARYWIHNGMLQLGGEKMSKSLGNIVTIRKFLEEHEGDVMRMVVLNSSYRAPLTFTDEVVSNAEKNLERLRSGLRPATPKNGGLSPEAAAELVNQANAARQAFTDAMDDDFNTPLALAALFELVRVINTARAAGATDEQLTPAQTVLRELTSVLGLRLEKTKRETAADPFIDLLLEIRSEMRKQKNWAMADLIRNRLQELGVTVEDTKEGSSWHW